MRRNDFDSEGSDSQEVLVEPGYMPDIEGMQAYIHTVQWLENGNVPSQEGDPWIGACPAYEYGDWQYDRAWCFICLVGMKKTDNYLYPPCWVCGKRTEAWDVSKVGMQIKDRGTLSTNGTE